jgi:hypothetical protein
MHRPVHSQLLRGETFRLDRPSVSYIEAFGYRRGCEAPRTAPLGDNRVRQPAACLHHPCAIPVRNAPPNLLVMEPLRRPPQCHKLRPGNPHVARWNLGDLRSRHIHAIDAHTPDRQAQALLGRLFPLLTAGVKGNRVHEAYSEDSWCRLTQLNPTTTPTTSSISIRTSHLEASEVSPRTDHPAGWLDRAFGDRPDLGHAHAGTCGHDRQTAATRCAAPLQSGWSNLESADVARARPRYAAGKLDAM